MLVFVATSGLHGGHDCLHELWQGKAARVGAVMVPLQPPVRRPLLELLRGLHRLPCQVVRPRQLQGGRRWRRPWA